MLLVSVTMQFKEEIFREFDEMITRYMHPARHPNIQFTEKTIDKWQRRMKNGEILYVVAMDKFTGDFLGFFGVENLPARDLEMGGWLKKSVHGHRFGQEAAAALKGWADQHLDYDYIRWPCAAENIASCKVAESLGGEVHRRYESTNESGLTWDFLEYRIPR